MNETDSRIQSTPAEIYSAEQEKQRTKAIGLIKELWASFIIRHGLAFFLMLFSEIQAGPISSVVDVVVFACGGGIWFLSWFTAIRLAIYVAKNNRMLRLWLIYLSWLPAAIVSAEALFVLEAFVST